MSRSRNVFRASADLFHSKDIERTIEKEELCIAYPTGNYEGDTTPITFDIYGDNLHYINLHESELHLNAELVTKAGAAVEDTVVIGCVNNLLDSMFSNVDIYINGRMIEDNSSHHPLKCYFKRILDLGDSKSVVSKTSLFQLDKTPNTLTYTENSAFKQRSKLVKDSGGINLVGKIQHSLLDQTDLLPFNASIRIVLKKSSQEFMLLGTSTTAAPVTISDYRIKISSAELHYKRVLLDDEIVKSHQKLFNLNKSAVYDIVKSEIRTIPIATNSVSAVSDTLFNGLLPQTIVIAIAKSKALNGSLSDNPFYFNNYDVSQVNLKIDKDSASYRNITVDFDKKFEHLYYEFLKNICPTGDNIISKDEFKTSFCFYFFSLYPSRIKGYKQIPRFGNIRLELKFSSPNSFPLTAIVYSETDSELYIDKYGNISQSSING